MKGNRILFALPVLAAAVAATALLSAPAFDSFKTTLLKAEGLSADVQVSVVGGTSTAYSIQLAKPDLLRLETADKLIVADGKEITTLLKDKNEYFTAEQTPQGLAEILGQADLQVWQPFFNEKAYGKVARVEKTGEKKIGGESTDVIRVEADAKGETTMDFYLSQKSKMPARLAINTKGLSGTESKVLAMSNVQLGSRPADLFTFKAPNGAQKVDLSVMNLGKWLWDYDQAFKLANASGKMVMIDFMASWCGPCHMMEDQVFSTDEFKKATANMILLKVDVDNSPDLAQKYAIEAMPTVKFIKPDGSIVHEFVGYGGFSQVMKEVETAKSKYGK